MTNHLASVVVYSKAKIKVLFKGNCLRDALNCGFSYFESEDHIVEYVVANARVIKQILGEINDSVLKPEGDSLGELWTAKIVLSDKLTDSEIYFSNNTFSAVIDLNLNSDSEEISDADI